MHNTAKPAAYRSIRERLGNNAATRYLNPPRAHHQHMRAGLHVSASAVTAKLGGVVVLLGLSAIRIGAPCRVVYVIDEPDRHGFAYGTLPGHPERGEEAFLVRRHHDATVIFTVTAFSRPASPPAKAAGPVGWGIQRRITSRYLRVIQR